MFTRSKHTTLSAIALLAAIMATAALGITLPMSDQTSTVFDPVGDTYFQNSPAFQDVVFGQMTKTAEGDFGLLLEMAGPVPFAPPLPPQGRSEIWWAWAFDLNPTTLPQGYPFGQATPGRRPEFFVCVSWDGAHFTGRAIDRRPLLSGGEAIITPVLFNINGAVLEAFLPFELIGSVPSSFHWSPLTVDWSGPVGSEGFNFVDLAEATFNP